jgi:hypothetical protein
MAAKKLTKTLGETVARLFNPASLARIESFPSMALSNDFYAANNLISKLTFINTSRTSAGLA